MEGMPEPELRARHDELTFQLLQARQALRQCDDNRGDPAQRALQDSLTGLPNRALFSDRLGRATARARRRPDFQYAVLYLDLDRFKLVNEGLGHAAGDQLLAAAATRFQSCLRPSDTIARVGDDEFAILIEELSSPKDATDVADRLLHAMKRPFRLGAAAEQDVFLTASIGIALSARGNDGAHDLSRRDLATADLIRDADTALFRAKALGRNRHQLFNAGMQRHAITLLRMQTDLRRAVDAGEFQLHYQPIVQLSSGRITAFEALIRWQHPQRGLIMPADFIAIAEETGIINAIGKWVLNQAARQAASWRRDYPNAGDIAVAVNLSARQFAQPDLHEQVQSALAAAGLPPHCLILEITESVVMDNTNHCAAVVHRLKNLGVKVNIDDFGTGYSSLACLHQFPIDTMKIDRSFIARLDSRPESGEIVRTIIALAHQLNMTVTAEGVETEAQFAHVQNMACESIQGFLLSKPLPAAAATELLAHRAGQLTPAPLRAAG